MSWLLFLLALCVSSAWSIRSAPVYALEDVEQHFEDFIKIHGKQYADENEKQARFEIFKVNLEEVNRANEGQNITIFGPTYFMDLTHEEFQKSFTGYVRDNATNYRTSCPYGSGEEFQNVDAPDSFDWRDRNAVTPVKNQGQCNSCYAFSTIANIESQYAMKYGQQLDLSEQQIIDCDHTNNGCRGGYMINAFVYLTDAGGAEGENDYPYKATDGPCTFPLFSYYYIPIKCDGIKNYQGGLITDAQCSVGSVNHAVLLVGYGTDRNGVPVWIGKNSWGTVWGDQGFFMMERGENKQSCGLMSDGMSSAVL